jgi:N-acetyl-alpha-D-glucosaminyl L-malate synthase BshA
MRVVTTLHGTDVTLVGTDPSYRAATRFALMKSQGITAVSRYLAQKTSELCGSCADIDVIYNFIDPSRYTPAVSKTGREAFANDSEVLLLHMSNFRPVKRVADVIRIFEGVHRVRPARLVLLGDGPDRAMATNLIQELGLTERVQFLGSRQDVTPVLRVADAFLLPSDGESFGLAALEAMGCGVPVVGALAGGLPEVVEDGVSGILAPLGDTATMSRRLTELLDDRDAIERFSKAARARAVGYFATDTIVPQYEALYERALNS